MTYEYDALNQLTRANDPNSGLTTKYYYDTAGNIQSRVEYVCTSDPVHTSTPNKVSYSYEGANLDLLTSYNGQSIIYDNSGNPTTYLGKTMTWTQGRSLSSVVQSGQSTIGYTYDANGLRQSKTIGSDTTWYNWNGTNVTYQQKGTEKIYFYYDTNGAPIAFKYLDSSNTTNNGTYQYVKNLQGDIIAIINSEDIGTGVNLIPAGTAVVQYSYDAWGKLLTTAGDLASSIGAINPLRYRGYYYDTETSFYYLQSRYYDAEVGRFISSDDSSMLLMSQGQLLGANVYAYCGNNTVNYDDPCGHWPFQLFRSVGDAILDFANIYNSLSICFNWEYCTFIYSIESRVYISAYNYYTTTRYSYLLPWTDKSRDSVHISTADNAKGYNLVAIAHTHSAYSIWYDSENFSSADKRVSQNFKMDIYVATPRGIIKKYSYSTKSISNLLYQTYHDYRTRFNFGFRTHICSKCAN